MNNPESAKPRKRFRRTISLIPTIFTVGNIFFGFYSIISVFHGQFDQAARLIGFAVICDMLDGRLARLTNTTSEMGMQLDSLSDVISFGVAPAILINFWVFQQVTPIGWIAPFGMLTSFIFVICGAMRLARFNVMAPGHKDFVGMPIPAAGGFIAALVHLIKVPEKTLTGAVFMLVIVYALALLMISTIRYPGFKNLQPAKGRSINVLFLAILVAGIYFYSEIVLILLASLYALSGLALKLYSSFRSRPAHNVSAA
jgi:CDP-diacylglycerol--serine O-phosphatidyltransferase